MAQQHPETKERIYTLEKLNQGFEKWVVEHFGSKRIWITCQVSKFNAKGRHLYLELTDSKDGITTAAARGVIWGANADAIATRFRQYDFELAEVLKSGNELLLRVNITFHKVYGLSLNILEVDPNAVLGDIERQKQETLARLKREGLTELQKKQVRSSIAKRIALVGSPGTSGYTDFKKELLGNNIYTRFVLKEFETSVQGDQAVPGIVAAIGEASRWDVDLIVLVRGGGSKMDLHVFNHYDVCKAIAYARVPVIVGIGHETDHTLADVVAHTSEKTPTAAARSIYLPIGIFSGELNEHLRHIRIYAQDYLNTAERELWSFTSFIYANTDTLLKGQQEVLDFWLTKTERAGMELLQRHTEWIVKTNQTVYQRSRKQLDDSQNELQAALQGVRDATLTALQGKRDLIYHLRLNCEQQALQAAKHQGPQEVKQALQWVELHVQHVLNTEGEQLRFLVQKMQLVDPSGLFDRGYTISTVDGTDLQWCPPSLVGRTLTTYSKNRILESTITKDTPDDGKRN